MECGGKMYNYFDCVSTAISYIHDNKQYYSESSKPMATFTTVWVPAH